MNILLIILLTFIFHFEYTNYRLIAHFREIEKRSVAGLIKMANWFEKKDQSKSRHLDS